MASPLAKLFIALGLEASDFERGLGKVTSDTKAMGAAVKVAAGVAVTAGFALLTKGALEGEQAMGKYQAATGASAEESKAFVRDMNALVGTGATVGRTFEDIAATGTNVAQQFGLAGEEAKALTSDFLEFGKVTGQGADVVNDFDAALDAFGEPAERAIGLMDQLIASNQKYGTDAGPAALKALAEMAPMLKALNLGLDDGVSMLNLFEAAGIDAAKVPAALNQAIRNLKPGQTFEDLVREISAIEDPLVRAQRASEVFGRRGGAVMANALKPGIDSLDDYGISAQQAAGKTERASEAMVTTADRIRMVVDRALSGLRGIGTEMGPLIAGIGMLAPTIAAAWGKLGGSGAVKSAIVAAGALGGKLYASAVVVGERLMSLIAAAWVAIGRPGSSVMMKATLAGSLTAGSFVAGLTKGLTGVGLGVLIGEMINEALRQAGIQTKGWNEEIFKAGWRSEGTKAWLASKGLGLGEQLVTTTSAEMARLHPTLFRVGQGAGEAVGEGLAASMAPGRLGTNVQTSVLRQFRSVMAGIPAAADEAMKQARREVMEGFGSIKDALANPPQFISRGDREANMEKRIVLIRQNINKARRVGDDRAQGYWERGLAKQELRLARFRGDVNSEWTGIERITDRKSQGAATKAIREFERLRDRVGAIDMVPVGTSLVTELAAGMRSALPGLRSAVSDVANVIALSQPRLGPPAPLGFRLAGAGGGLTINQDIHPPAVSTRDVANKSTKQRLRAGGGRG